MANEEQLSILRQGVDVWNKWRSQHVNVTVNFSGVDLSGANLSEANLSKANLSEANLSSVDLSKANLSDSNLIRVNLKKAILYGAKLRGANFSKAVLVEARFCHTAMVMGEDPDEKLHETIVYEKTDFTRVNLVGANLIKADLRLCDLSGANLTGANLNRTKLYLAVLSGVNLNGCQLRDADLSFTTLGHTIFSGNDLSEVVGLKNVFHREPSIIGATTIQLSKGKIPEAFLRGCGLSDLDIVYSKLYNPDLTNEEITKIQYRIYDIRASQAIQISPLFISYSHADKPFVDQLDTALTKKGIRFWRDIHDATAGRLETQIDRAIRQNPTVLLILSKNSIKSDWVEHEVHTARKLEKEMGRDMLCPVALDDSWKNSSWEKRMMEQVMKYNILDFSAWENNSKFGNIFNKLIDGLGLFYK